MSGKNNVNPGQYKVAGRERPDDLARERIKQGRDEGTKVTRRHKPGAKSAKPAKSR